MKKISALQFSAIMIVFVFLIILIAGCSPAGKISGTYEGVLPCADCEGINTVLKLNPDKSFEIEETYLGRDDNPFISKGSYTVNNTGKITLTSSDSTMYPNPRYFEVISDNEIRMLDIEGNKIDSDLNYSLTKNLE